VKLDGWPFGLIVRQVGRNESSGSSGMSWTVLKLSNFFKKTLDTLPDLLHNLVSLLLTQQGTKR
jgi:hypothetical protein